jgi:hypothetical protein
MKKLLLSIFTSVSFLVLLVVSANNTFAQNYTSNGNGNWNNAANWTNTSGNGTDTPSSNGGYGTRNLNHNQTITGNYSTGSATLNISANKTLNISGNLTTGGGGTINVYGILSVDGNIILNSRINVLQGGKLITKNNLRINSADYLSIGTGVAPPQFADLIVYGNLNAVNSGDVYVNRNGRVAIFGDISDNNGGGTILRVNNGGQMYVDGDINYSGGGSDIQNNNTASPFGLYVNGEINNTGGGSGTTTNVGNQKTLIDTNPDFFNWLSGIEQGPLPIELKSFTAQLKNNNIQLDWVTAKEENFSHFEVERSVDMENFEMIGLVQGQGESLSDVFYELEDSDAPFGVIYYRLKAVDIDDTFDYSPVVQIENGFNGQLSVYPNPAAQSGNMKIRLPSAFQGNINHIAIYDLQGSKMQEFFSYDPTKELSIDSQIKAGLYLLKIRHNGIEENIRVLIK